MPVGNSPAPPITISEIHKDAAGFVYFVIFFPVDDTGLITNLTVEVVDEDGVRIEFSQAESVYFFKKPEGRVTIKAAASYPVYTSSLYGELTLP